jgi:hypothetical protein
VERFSTRLSLAGVARDAQPEWEGHGGTHCWYDAAGSTRSTSRAEVSCMRRAPQLGLHLRVYRFFAGGPFWTTAAFTSALNARVSTRTVYLLCDEGKLAHVRIANAIRGAGYAGRARSLTSRVDPGTREASRSPLPHAP